MNPSSRTGRVTAPCIRNPTTGTEHQMADAEIDAKPVDQDTLVADIDRPGAELARTIDAISDRVSPKKNVHRALEQIRQRASQVDPVMAGAAATAAPGSGTTIFLAPRRKRSPAIS